MTKLNEDVIAILRAADPLDADDLQAWSTSPRREGLARDIVATSDQAPPRRARRRFRVVAIAVAGTLAVGGAAVASSLLGGPAPDRVRAHLAELDHGMPPDLRYNPDLANARAVAATTSGTLYAADLPDGGYCIEAATADGQPRGGTCISAADAAARPIEVIAPIPAGDNAPLLIGGRLNRDGLTALEAMYTGTPPTSVELGIDRYFLIEVPAAERTIALDNGVVLSATDRDTQAAVHIRVPPLRDDARRLDQRQPIFVSTVSDGDDLTLVLGIEGRVHVQGYDSLELTYPDGTVVAIPTRSDGSYRFDLPADRRPDFARAFGILTARDAAGDVLATAPVASVAAWRARDH